MTIIVLAPGTLIIECRRLARYDEAHTPVGPYNPAYLTQNLQRIIDMLYSVEANRDIDAGIWYVRERIMDLNTRRTCIHRRRCADLDPDAPRRLDATYNTTGTAAEVKHYEPGSAQFSEQACAQGLHMITAGCRPLIKVAFAALTRVKVVVSHYRERPCFRDTGNT